MVSGKELVLDVILSVIMFVMFGIYLYVLYKKQINIEPEYRYIIIIKDTECMVPNIAKIEDNKVKNQPKINEEVKIKSEAKSEINEVKSEIKTEFKEEVKPKSEIKSEVKLEPKSEINDEYENIFENETD